MLTSRLASEKFLCRKRWIRRYNRYACVHVRQTRETDLALFARLVTAVRSEDR